ncbi:MAG: zinc-ribbon and DUF3426 domain-containing protein, partial [Rhodocyclaceae bacterium]|nr:zinc-ribbon and DUF3426 domain-containing protein [Rhodocyclaceae bacterium]
PHCQTTFRVAPEQLKARLGQVRCGTCRGVFNAIDSLADEVPVVIGPVALPSPLAGEGPGERGGEGEAFIYRRHYPSPQPLSRKGRGAFSAMPVTSGHPSPPPPSEPAGEDVEDVENQPSPDLPMGGEATAAAAETPVTVVANAAETPVPATWEPMGEIGKPPPSRRWPWLTGLLILLVLAAGQLLYIFRVELAVLAPELRPALLAACEQLGCTLPRPQKAELIGIESSDLAPAGATGAADAGRLLLTATLKNRAPFDQEYPHLELTLTDTQDTALLRKVLAPAEYLPADHDATTGFAANAEAAVRLTLEITGLPAVGYRLYLFYP